MLPPNCPPCLHCSGSRRFEGRSSKHGWSSRAPAHCARPRGTSLRECHITACLRLSQRYIVRFYLICAPGRACRRGLFEVSVQPQLPPRRRIVVEVHCWASLTGICAQRRAPVDCGVPREHAHRKSCGYGNITAMKPIFLGFNVHVWQNYQPWKMLGFPEVAHHKYADTHSAPHVGTHTGQTAPA